jgi:hypothetical protein
MKKYILITILSLFCLPAIAEKGLIVKTSGEDVYIDITEMKTPPAAGSEFVIYREGEAIVNPVTGKNLGSDMTETAKGTITEVHEKYAKGKITSKTEEIKPGFFAELKTAAQAEIRKLDGQAQDVNINAAAPVWESEPVTGTIVDVAAGDFLGDGSALLAAAEEQKLSLYRKDGNKLVEISSIALPSTVNIVSLETLKAGYADLKKDSLMINTYDSQSDRLDAAVFTLENTEFKRANQLKWLVRPLNPVTEPAAFYTQEVYTTQGFNLSFIRPLEYKNAGFSSGSEKLSVPRINWLFGLTVADLDNDGKKDAVYVDPGGSLTVQYDKKSKYASSRSGFDRTPNRARIKNNTVYFHSRIPLKKVPGGAEFFGLSNIPKFILADAFAKYVDADLCKFSWNGTKLSEVSQTKLGGPAWNITYGSFGGFEGIIAPVNIIGDMTVIKIYKF